MNVREYKEYKLIKKSKLFDSNYYLLNNPDVRRADVNPLLHYVKYGWKERRNPSAIFNTNDYLSLYDDVKVSGINPLVHYIKYGKKEGRKTNSVDKKVGIVIVTYNSWETVRTTLISLSNSKNNVNFEIVVVDNGSNKENLKKIRAFFQQHIKRNDLVGRIIFLESNLGFSGGNNIGIKYFLEKQDITHICLLNSDVIVTDNWLDYLIEDNFDVTGPVTNAAGNEQTIMIDYSTSNTDFDFDVINNFSRKRHSIYLGHKNTTDILYFFCVVIKRRVIESIGLLDERFFPGSFEDNDYCKRMLDAEYTLFVIRDCYVHHFGSSSFSKLGMTERIDISNINRKRYEEKWGIHYKDTSYKLALSARLDINYFINKEGNEWAFLLLDKSMASIEKMIDEWEASISYYKSNQYFEHLLQERSLDNFSTFSTKEVSNNQTGFAKYTLESESGFLLMKILLKKILYRIKKGMWFLNIREKIEESNSFRLVNEVASINTENKKVVCVFSPIYNSQNEKDGYIQRIKTIDKLVLDEYLRIYINDDGTYIKKIKLEIINKDMVSIIYDSHNQKHREKIFKLVSKSGILYTHSILRFMTDTIHSKMLDLFTFTNVKKIWDMHGAVPEEYLLSGHELGCKIANEVEKFIFDNSDVIIVVTNSMREHLEKKYGHCNGKIIVLPVIKKYDTPFLDNINSKQITENQKITIVYSGGLQKWQNIDLMQDIIDQTMDFYNYKILVPNPAIFENMWGNKSQKQNIIIRSKSPDQMGEEYRTCHYGLVLRDDIIVNNVACPTKIIEYLEYGIVPVFKSPKIGDFVKMGLEYIDYKDLLDKNMPSEKERLRMVEKNRNVLNLLISLGKNSIRFLSSYLKDENNIYINRNDGFTNPSIGLVVNSFDKGGLEQAVFNLYEGYRQLGYETYILCQSTEIGHFSNKLYSPNHIMIFGNNQNTFINFCKEKNIRWLHYHYNTFLIDKVREYGIRTIYSLQNIYSWLSDEEITARSYLINSADFIVAGSSFSKDYYCTRTNTQLSRVTVIPIGVNTKDLDNKELDDSFTRSSLKISKSDIVLGLVASFHEVKHQMNMIGAMEELIKINPQIKLIFLGNIGHQDYFNKVKECWESSTAKNNIIHIPFIDHSQLGEFLRQVIDIFILPSIQEGCSNAVIDALYCGKPMLLTDVGNASDLQHLESVTVVNRAFDDLYSFRQSDISKICLEKNCRNTQEIVKGIIDISNHLKEKEKAAEEASKKYAKICDKNAMVKSYIDLIKNTN